MDEVQASDFQAIERMIRRTGVVEGINGNIRKSGGRVLGQRKPEVKSEGHGLVVKRDGDSWFCLEQSVAPEIGEGIIHIWLKWMEVTVATRSSELGRKWHYLIVLVLKATG